MSWEIRSTAVETAHSHLHECITYMMDIDELEKKYPTTRYKSLSDQSKQMFYIPDEAVITARKLPMRTAKAIKWRHIKDDK